MQALSEQGVRLAIDDFGIGNTSINQLRNFPLRTLKIDRSFIVPLTSDAGSIVLVRAMIDLAHEFGLMVVAEGVEDADTAATLAELGCDLAQGFLWSPAVSAMDVVETIASIDQAADGMASATSGSAGTGWSPRPR
jgi:EAL domain-containing protein (putative c-di-GMP-specific phosphodiesterase class I)